MKAGLLVALLIPSLGWAGRRFDVLSWADFCSYVCEFRLCVTEGERPSLRPCDELLPAAPGIVIRTTGYPPIRLRLRGVTARLTCYHPGAPCGPTPRCESDDECGDGLSCVPHLSVCGLATTCPGDGYYPGVAGTDEKFIVIGLSDPCSRLCEFRLCLVDEELVPCAPEAAPDITVRAPVLLAHGHTGRQLPFVLKYGDRQHVTLKCQLVGAPCRSCDVAADCFTGGVCVDGRCSTTALCQ